MPGRRAVLYSGSLPDDSGGALLVRGLRGALHAGEDTGLIVPPPLPDGASPEEHLRRERENLTACAADPSVAAAVVMYRGGDANRGALRALLRTGKPVVLLGRDVEFDAGDVPPGDFVGVNDFDSARRVVAHLIARGHRSIAHVTNHEPSSGVADRCLGYRRALEAAGLPVRPELIVAHEHDALGRLHVSPDLLRRLRSLPEPPTALFAVHDWAALSALLTASLTGLRVPRDLAVAGFDGIAAFRAGAPLLTSAEQPFEEMGRHAGLLVRDRLDRPERRVKRCVYLDAPLRVHESTGGAGDSRPAGDAAANDLLVRDGAWRARLVFHYLVLHAADPVTLEDLAAVARVSPRRLLEDFRRHEKTSPMRALQEERMARVRAELRQASPTTTVAEVAYRWGVTQLGRFSGQYRRKYGEAPSDTLRAARGTAGSAARFSRRP